MHEQCTSVHWIIIWPSILYPKQKRDCIPIKCNLPIIQQTPNSISTGEILLEGQRRKHQPNTKHINTTTNSRRCKSQYLIYSKNQRHPLFRFHWQITKHTKTAHILKYIIFCLPYLLPYSFCSVMQIIFSQASI